MLTNTAFKEYYKTKLFPELKQFEIYRQKELAEYRTCQVTRVTSIAIFGIISFLALAHLSGHKTLSNFLLYNLISNDIRVFVAINIVIVLLAKYARERMFNLLKQFSYSSKNILFNKIIGAYDGFKYYPLSGIDLETINYSNLFTNYNQYKSEDYIKGNHRGVDLKLSEVALTNTTYREINNNGRIEIVTDEISIFKGLFIICSVRKKFSSSTYIIPNAWLKFLNSLPKSLSRVYLEDPEFENIFDVYGGNQIEARYLLTPAFMERLKSVSKQFKIRCCFKDEKLYLAVELNEEFLPALKLTEEITQERIKKLYLSINTILSIIDELKLDINIGL